MLYFCRTSLTVFSTRQGDYFLIAPSLFEALELSIKIIGPSQPLKNLFLPRLLFSVFFCSNISFISSFAFFLICFDALTTRSRNFLTGFLFIFPRSTELSTSFTYLQIATAKVYEAIEQNRKSFLFFAFSLRYWRSKQREVCARPPSTCKGVTTLFSGSLWITIEERMFPTATATVDPAILVVRNAQKKKRWYSWNAGSSGSNKWVPVSGYFPESFCLWSQTACAEDKIKSFLYSDQGHTKLWLDVSRK